MLSNAEMIRICLEVMQLAQSMGDKELEKEARETLIKALHFA